VPSLNLKIAGRIADTPPKIRNSTVC